jgi:predicted nucleic acid-binding protein
MKRYVLDTSVTVAWYLDEDFSAEARVWQDRLLKGKAALVVPSLHYWEFANVLRTLVVRNELEESLARDIYEIHSEAPLERAEPDETQILDIAFEFNATAYDAVYIALGRQLGVPLITAERTTTEWVVKLGDDAIMIG